MITREIFKYLIKELNKKQITALVGARQVGKIKLKSKLKVQKHTFKI